MNLCFKDADDLRGNVVSLDSFRFNRISFHVIALNAFNHFFNLILQKIKHFGLIDNIEIIPKSLFFISDSVPLDLFQMLRNIISFNFLFEIIDS